MSKRFKIRLTRRNSNDALPYTVEDVFTADTSLQAHELAKRRFPGYEAEWFDIVEVNDAASAPMTGGRSKSGTSGTITSLLGLVVVGILIWRSGEIREYVAGTRQASGPRLEEPQIGSADPTDQAAATDGGESQPRSHSVVGMDLTPRQEQKSPGSEGVAAAQGQAPVARQLPSSDAAVSQAWIVDSRKQVVLQSEPKMSSKNVAKIDTGSVVQVVSDEGKWVQVRTEDGLVGYVRRSQLEMLQ